MSVSAQETSFRHTANGVSTVFAFECKVLDENDLYITLDDAEITSGFTVSGIGENNGGTVTFDTAPADGVVVGIDRIISLERSTDYQQNGDFRAAVVNPDFDRLWMALQQHNSRIGRALQFPVADTTDPGLPDAESRANNLLGFDEDGKPVAVAPAAQSASALQALLAASAGASLVGYGDRTVAEAFKQPAGEFFQIPVYPQSFKDQATRIVAGAGAVKSATFGSPSDYITDTAPRTLDQLWTEANIDPIGTNWIAHKAIQTTVGPNGNGMIAGLFSEISTYAPNKGEIAGIVGMARALADRIPTGSGSGGDMWGVWAIATNNGWKSHAIGAEINAVNLHDHWYEDPDPLNNDPADFTFGLQIYPDWSTKTGTRAISIRPNATAGWSTGILVTGFTDQGLFIDSKQAFRDPGTNALPADPIGLIFGQNIVTKMAVRHDGALKWKLNVEGDFLMWRHDASNWYFAMKDSDKSLYFMNQLFRMGTDGRLNVGDAANVGNITGAGISLIGDLQHPLALTRSATALATAPGANVCVLRSESAGGGQGKLVAYFGTSTVGVTLAAGGAGFS